MKKTLAMAIMVAAMSGTVMAQTTSTPPATTTMPSTTTTMPSTTTTLPAKSAMSALQFHASDIIGTNIKNSAGDTVGEVKDLIISPHAQDNVTQAIISVGGFLGIGDTLVAVPYDNLQISRINDKVHVIYNTTKAALEGMPKFEYMKPGAGDTTLQASNLIGSNVKNPADNTIGEVKDLIITGSDQVPQVIISVGGFLGIGDKLVAVPYKDLQVSHVNDKQHVVYNATQETLKSMPSFSYN